MRARLVRFAGAAAAVLVLAVVASSGAVAQNSSFLQMRKVDSVDPKNVKLDFIWTGSSNDLGGLTINQLGNDMKTLAPASPVTQQKGIVIVIDTGPGMDKDGALDAVRKGAVDMVNAAPEGTKFAVVQAGDRADLKTDLTVNKPTVITAIVGVSDNGVNKGGLGATKGSAVWKALKIAGDTLKIDPNLQPNIVLAVADNDDVNPKDEPQGKSAVTSSGSSLWAVERLGSMDPTPYDNLVAQAGGQVLATDNPQAMKGLMTQAGNTITSQQYQVAYNSGLNRQEVADVTLTVGGQSSNANFIMGGVYQGSQSLRPTIIAPATGPSVFGSPLVYGIALLLIMGAAAGFAYAIASLFVKDDLSDVLQPYADYGDDGDDENASALGKSALIARAVELTEQVAENQGVLTRAEGALERANLPLRAGEALFVYAVIVVVVTVIGLFFTRSMFGGIFFGVLGAMIPVVVVNFLASKRRKAFMSQLPDTLSLLSGTLKAGYSLMQGVEAVSQEVSDPMGIELRRVVTEARLGRPLEESLESSADRMDSPDFAWAVMAIRIQREVGGNLSELLMTVADTMVQRERLRRDVASLTAEGRVSAVILAGLPPGLGLLMWVLNPEYMSALFTDGLGIAMLITAVVSMLIGFLWMRKIINIEI